MWRECSPGGRFLMSKVILTPLAAAVRVAVPTLWPCAFLISTVTGLAACARVSCTTTRLAADKSKAAHVRDFIIRSPRRDGSPEFGFSQKNCHPNLAQDRRRCNNLSLKRYPDGEKIGRSR